MRERVERHTGHTLEESFEGLTLMFADAIAKVVQDDQQPKGRGNDDSDVAA